jgi:putative redox protein
VTGIVVDYRGGDRFDVDVRGHVVVVDQPVADGGGDAGPTPAELFVASVAACVAYYARRYLARHGLAADGLRVTASFAMGTDRPARVAGIDVEVMVPGALPPGRMAGLEAVVAHCTVHNSIVQAPVMAIRVVSGVPVMRSAQASTAVEAR